MVSEMSEQQRSELRWRRFVRKTCECSTDAKTCGVHNLDKKKDVVLRLQWMRWRAKKIIEEEFEEEFS